MPPLFIGGRYIQLSSGNIRTIEAIRGAEIQWRDKYGGGHCCLETFKKWLETGDLAPDSPAPPPGYPKRAKYITKAFREFLNREVAFLRALGLREITIERKTTDLEMLFGGSLWIIQGALKRIESALKDYYSRPMHMLNAIDTDAARLQMAITSVLETLNASEPPAGADWSPVLRALSDGLASVNRLRAGLAPYLAQ